MNLGEKLKTLRRDKGITQIELAKILNVDKGVVANYETNRRFPNIHILVKIADYFEVTTDYLLGRTQI